MKDDGLCLVKAGASGEVLYKLSYKQRYGRIPALEKRGEIKKITEGDFLSDLLG